MDFTLPPDAIDLRDLLCRFIEKDVRPLEMAFFTSGELEPAASERLRKAIEQMGLWGAARPERAGGFGLELLTICVMDEVLGSTFLPLDLGEICPLLYACEGEQITRYLEPVLAGARRAVIAAREPDALLPEAWTAYAQPIETGYRLDGTKCLARLPRPEDFLVVLAQSPQGPTAFFIETGQDGWLLEVGDPNLLRLEDCRVETGAVLGKPGGALRLVPEEAVRAWVRDGARTVGLASRLLEMAAAYAADWVSFGEPLYVRPAVRRALSGLQVQIECVRWLVYHAAWQADQGEDLRDPAAQVRIAADDLQRQAIDLVTMVHGGPGPAVAQVVSNRIAGAAVPWETRTHALAAAAAFLSKGWMNHEYEHHLEDQE